MGIHGVSENISDFGKDIGLVHEAIVTGRKLGAGIEFWSRMAHDEFFFSYIFNLTEYSNYENMCQIEYVESEKEDGDFVLLPEKKQLPGRICKKIEWNPKKIKLFNLKQLSTSIDYTNVGSILETLKTEKVFKSFVLESLLKNPALLPNKWKFFENYRSTILFLGDLYYLGADKESVFVKSLSFSIEDNTWYYQYVNIKGLECEYFLVIALE